MGYCAVNVRVRRPVLATCRLQPGRGHDITSLEDRASSTRCDVPIHWCRSEASDDPWLTVSARRTSWHLARLWPAVPIASVSGNFVGCSCFRILALSCGVWSVDVHGRISPSRAVVTRLVTHAGA